jgi:hypothetical protein
MINDDATTPVITRYRASVEDVATPILDQVIMAAAGRQAARRRFARRAGEAFFVAALAVIGIGVAWHAHQSNTNRSTSTVTNYGMIEGLTRPYLLQVGGTQYSGPGLNEGTQ